MEGFFLQPLDASAVEHSMQSHTRNEILLALLFAALTLLGTWGATLLETSNDWLTWTIITMGTVFSLGCVSSSKRRCACKVRARAPGNRA